MIKTLKQRLYREFALRGTTRYLEWLPEIVEDYNNTVHSTIKTKPVLAVLPRNEKKILRKVYSKQRPFAKRILFKPGDFVRISRFKRTFQKGYELTFSNEIFKVTAVNRKFPPVYAIESLEKEPILGTFYTEELQRVSDETMGVYLVRKVSKPRKSDGKVKVYWADMPDNKATWENPENVLPDVK